MNLVVSLEFFLTNKTQNIDLNALLSEKIETICFAMTRCSLLYHFLNFSAMLFTSRPRSAKLRTKYDLKSKVEI